MKRFMQHAKETLLVELAADTAMIHETKIAKWLKSLGAEIWKDPSGADSSFPDIGATLTLDSGITVALHIEAKAGLDAQLGRVNWKFADGKFSVVASETKEKGDERMAIERAVISILNSSDEANANAATILKELRTYISKDVSEISNSSLGIIKDTKLRYKLLKNYATNATRLGILAETPVDISKMFTGIYKTKFTPVEADFNCLLVIFDTMIFLFDTVEKLPSDVKAELEAALGIDSIEYLPSKIIGKFEARISPRGLNSGTTPRLDIIATTKIMPSQFKTLSTAKIDI